MICSSKGIDGFLQGSFAGSIVCPSPAKLEKINLKAPSQKLLGGSGFYLTPGSLKVSFLQILGWGKAGCGH